MRKRNLLTGTVSAVIGLLAVLVSGCAPKEPERTLHSIAVTTPPTKVEYTVGETFDPAGMVVTAKYSDNTSEVVVDYTIDKTQPLTLEDEEVTITYQSKTATVEIEVKEAQVQHTHVYDREVAEAGYLKSEATCTQAATYYKSCACGEMGTETFTSGDPLGHDFAEEWSYDGENHWKMCQRDGCAEKDELAAHSGGTATCEQKAVCAVCGQEYGQLAQHVYDREVAEAGYLKSEATCTQAATYYKSCACGEKGTETFTVGEPLGHDFAEEWSHDETSHWKECLRDGCTEKTESGAHTYEDGICTICGAESPDLAAARAVDTAIAELPALAELTYGDKQAADDARSAYDALTQAQQALVKNLAVLEAAEAKIAELGNVVASISLNTEGVRLEYFVGETFSSDGLVVTATLVNGQTDVLEVSDYSVSQPDMSQSGKVTVTVTCTGTQVSANFEITVKNYDALIEGSGYYLVEAENLDQTEWIIQPGREGMQIETPTNPTSGGKSIGSLSSGSKVIINLYSDIEATVNLTGIFAQVGETYSLSDNVKFTINNSEIPVPEATFGSAPGIQYTNWKNVVFQAFDINRGLNVFVMEIVKEGLNIDCFQFTVTDKNDVRELTQITVTPPSKTTYQVGETFDPAGMVVTAVYSNEDTETISNYSVDRTAPFTGDDIGSVTVTITYLDKSATVQVTVEAGAQKIDTPDNSGNKIFLDNTGNGYIEIDRTGKTLFGNGTDYVKMYIYDSVDADKDAPLGTVYMVYHPERLATQGQKDTLEVSADLEGGSAVAKFDGGPGNMFDLHSVEYANLVAVFKEALGDNYTEGTTYYLAFQVIAEAEPVNGIQYSDSDVSAIGSAGWTI